ncbi:uncharacterized protein A4U43_C03F24830 [Asparagus officinalis]|uniref:L-gulonolactone oxidase n=1 Tax=Asparagus officinalis TaxID=4686 RepID=A0A5P1FDP6_ASPOF|nr:probable truncated L-gulonolactone oxidase 7, mitochondrial [Asparagus officinalis]ONK76184.1 uncharacterized protein A4U43_C03F24830 [Asparagus officinalis]
MCGATTYLVEIEDPHLKLHTLQLLQVTLRLQPLFKRSLTYIPQNDTDLADKALNFGNQHEFADIRWYPAQRMAIYRIDDRVPVNTTGNGVYDMIGLRSVPTSVVALVRSTEETTEATSNADGKCADALSSTSAAATANFGLTNDGLLFTGYPVIGFQNQMQSSGSCLSSPEDGLITACAWDPRFKGSFFQQSTVSIGLSKVKDFILDIQKLRDLQPKSLCNVELYDGILMRYIKASTAYLGKQEDAIDFDITYYRSRDPMSPRLYEDVLEEIEQMALIKYGGIPHWGKSRNVAFDGVISKFSKRSEFLKVKDAYDPSGLFSNEWTDQILGIRGRTSIFKKGCALEGLCICSEDTHCAPEKGYFCRQGKVYTEARVCTALAMKN